MAEYKGASKQAEIGARRRRKDTRPWGRRLADSMDSGDGAAIALMLLPLLALAAIAVPFSGELLLLLTWLCARRFVHPDRRGFDLPLRVPMHGHVGDGSYPKEVDATTGRKRWRIGAGIAYLARDIETREQVYISDTDLRAHMLVLGTTGSGKPQPGHARVLTPDGWRPMGSLRVGDLVCTPDGDHAQVLRVFEQGPRHVWRVLLRDGRKAEATDDHIWRVLVRQQDGTEVVQTLQTMQVRNLLDQGVRVLLPVVRRNRRSALAHQWVPVRAVEHRGKHDCRCIEVDHPDHLYVTDDRIVTHNTEFLLGLVFNALVQNTGCIYVDGKGDPRLEKEIFRLARYLGREDDLLLINFIMSGRDFLEKQTDKVTNRMNMMANTSSGMLVELIVALMDDSGASGDMWKGRAIMFVAALTRPLIYLRDKGHINLSPEKYLEYFELNVIEELVWEHNGKYGELFDVIVAPLRSYLVTLPGYQKTKLKKQEQKTLEQHGFIVMQLTRTFNDLNFNYGHIFKGKVGDVDFYDVVVNRRLLVVLLPALERAPDSLKMLGKLIVGNIKQMMAGCLGNRVEGVVREIIDSRPTNASVPFYCILDEYGYYAVLGFAVAPAQARSLGFSVIFAAQDFSSLKKSSPEEADATWENTNVRAIGRLTSGKESETWRRIVGAGGDASQAMQTGFERKMGTVDEKFRSPDSVQIERDSRLDYDDLAMQADGEFTLLVGKKEQGGRTGGVRVIRGMGFYTGGRTPKEMRINDLVPVEAPEPADMPQNRKAVDALMKSLLDGSFGEVVQRCIKPDATLVGLHQALSRNHTTPERPRLGRPDAALAALGWFLADTTEAQSGPPRRSDAAAPPLPVPPATSPLTAQSRPAPATPAAPSRPPQQQDAPTPAPAATVPVAAEAASAQDLAAARALSAVCATVQSTPKDAPSAYTSAVPVEEESDEEIRIDSADVTSLLQVTSEEAEAFRQKAMPMLRSFMLTLDDVPEDADADTAYDAIAVADRGKLLDAEMAAMERPFSSLEEKFEAEERIATLQRTVAESTKYPLPPTPEPRSVDDMKLSLSELARRCQQEVKDALRDDGTATGA